MIPRTPLIFSAGILVALLLGTRVPSNSATLFLILTFLFVATLGTVGGLEKGWQSRATNYRGAIRLLLINVLSGSVPMALIGLWIGTETPAGLGFLILAIVPVAGGIPAYASALGVPAERITLFALISYVIALFVTPVLMGVVVGTRETQGVLWWTLMFGLIIPSVMGIFLARPLTKIPIRTRRTFILCALLVVMFGIGSSLSGLEFNLDTLGAPLALVVLIGLLRAPLGAVIGAFLNRSAMLETSVNEAMLAGGYRNCALAGVAALAIGQPAAAIPGTLGLASEAILMALLALREILNRRSVRRT